MLNTEPEFVESGVPVFRDHADPDLFWYLPADIAIARKNNGRGDPIFSFIKFRDPQGNGGGFLSFQVDLSLPEKKRQSLEAKILELGLSKRPRLTQVPFTDGAVQCVTLDSGAPANGDASSGGASGGGAAPAPPGGGTGGGASAKPSGGAGTNPLGGVSGDSGGIGSTGGSSNPLGGLSSGGAQPRMMMMAAGAPAQGGDVAVRLVNQVLGAARPSLQGNNTAIFTLVLTQDGAEVVLAALKGGQALLGVIYQLNYTAMQPALNVKVTAKMDQVYRFLGASVSAQYKFLRGDLAAAIERLKADKVIKIERTDTQGTDASGQELDAATKMFTDMVMKDFFTPMLVPGNPRTPLIPNTPYNPNMPYNPNGAFPPANPANPYGMGTTGGAGYGIGMSPYGGASAFNSPLGGSTFGPSGGGLLPSGGGSIFGPTGGGTSPLGPATNPTGPTSNPLGGLTGGPRTPGGTSTGSGSW